MTVLHARVKGALMRWGVFVEKDRRQQAWRRGLGAVSGFTRAVRMGLQRVHAFVSS